jgi:hypothetical protein
MKLVSNGIFDYNKHNRIVPEPEEDRCHVNTRVTSFINWTTNGYLNISLPIILNSH